MTDFTLNIMQWYERHKRDLPWRRTKDPYNIWISEIILQQTQVKQGIDYYVRFIDAWPDVQSLAAANQQEVLKMWQGLGYYSRARNLHAAAQDIAIRLNGKMPVTKKELQQLKGIGPYTAAAIASIAYGLPHAVVDGNVYRLLARYFAISTAVDSNEGKKQFEQLANELMAGTSPGDFNQAMMEMGALICTPANPKCNECNLQKDCKSYETGKQMSFPVKEKKTLKRDRYFNYLIINDSKGVGLVKRGSGDIWQGLFEFPLLEADKLLSAGEIARAVGLTSNGASSCVADPGDVKHILTHQNINARFFFLNPSCLNFDLKRMDARDMQYVPHSDIDKYPVPRLIEKKLVEFININNT